jgi:hypothetical protein
MSAVMQYRGTRNHRDFRPGPEANLLRHLRNSAGAV